MRLLVLLTPLLLLSGVTSHAEPTAGPLAIVRGYFDALDKNDFPRALSLTDGAALRRTAQMVGALKRQARAANAQVELKVRKLQVASGALEDEDGTVPVDVDFHIDVIGKKWIFKKVARQLAGHAQFMVAADSAPQRIVSIEGSLK